MTFLELLITVAILAILAAMAAPSFRTSIEQGRLRAQVTQFNMALRLAQSEAIKRSRTVVVCKSDNPETATTPACGLAGDTSIQWESGWLIFVDDDGDGARDTGETIVRRSAPLVASTTLRGSAAVATAVAFQATGEPSAAGTFVLCENGDITRGRAIFLGLNGRLYLADQTSSGAPANDSGAALASTACLSPP